MLPNQVYQLTLCLDIV